MDETKRIQYNLRVTPELHDQMQEINTKFFAGSKNKADLLLFLVQFAQQSLTTASIEIKITSVINGSEWK